MVAAARENGKALMIAQNQRLTAAHQYARKLVEEGTIGRILTFRTTFGHGGPEKWSINPGNGTWFFNEEKAHEAGFQLLYHNHDFEFVQQEDGTLAYDYIFSSNGRTRIQNEFDVCWVDYAGQDPAAYLKKYEGNIPVVHLKDYKLEGKLSSAPYALSGLEKSAENLRALGLM